MPFVKQLDFISNSAPTLRTLATNIRMACGQGMSVIVNNWLANDSETVFNVDVISTHWDVYKKVEDVSTEAMIYGSSYKFSNA